MRTENFSALYTLDYNLENSFAMCQRWVHPWFQMSAPRKTSCLLYFRCFAAEYRTERNVISVPRGAVVYVPEGAVYTTHFTDFTDDKIDTILIEFSLRKQNEPFVVTTDITILPYENEAWLADLFYLSTEESSPAAIKAITYQILNHLSLSQQHKKILSTHFRQIAKGIQYLESNPTQDKSLQEIANMCSVSTAYFRRLFKEYAGVTPSEYRITNRIEYAKRLLRLGTMTIAEVADKAGFEDPAYFCRIFKRRCGISPGKYIHR